MPSLFFLVGPQASFKFLPDEDQEQLLRIREKDPGQTGSGSSSLL